MKYVIEPDLLATELVARVEAAKLSWHKSQPWTNAVKSSLHAILESKAAEIRFTCADKQQCEFLLDLIAWDKDDTKGVVLGAECEWLGELSEIARDFEKLLVIKSPIKLMIFASSKRKDSQFQIEEELKRLLSRYRDHLVGERYVFVDFARFGRRKSYWLEIPCNGELKSLPPFTDIPLPGSPFSKG